jgi:hypothetical protein
MIGHNAGRDDGHDDFPELDALIEEAMNGILTKVETVFDPHERFADLVRRTVGPAQPPADRTDRLTDSAALTAVCDQIDSLAHFIVEATRAAGADPFPGSAFLEAARQPLRRLRAELAGRTATREQAEQILGQVEQNVTHADTILGGGLDDRLNQLIPGRVRSSGPISTQLPALKTAIARLYDDAHDTSVLAPSR